MGEDPNLWAKLFAPIPHVSADGVLAGPTSVANPADEAPVEQGPGYEETEDLAPDPTLADPAVAVETVHFSGGAV